MEKEVLQQYSQFIHQLYMLVYRISYIYQFSIHFIFHRLSRKFFLISSLAYGLFWGMNTWIMAFLYWRALVLVEQKEIKSNEIIM